VHRAVHVGGSLLRSARASEERILGNRSPARQRFLRDPRMTVVRMQQRLDRLRGKASG
jgi:hypothetical protein